MSLASQDSGKPRPSAADPQPSRYQIHKQVQQESQLESFANPTITSDKVEDAFSHPFNAISNFVIAISILDHTKSRRFGWFQAQSAIIFYAMSAVLASPSDAEMSTWSVG